MAVARDMAVSRTYYAILICVNYFDTGGAVSSKSREESEHYCVSELPRGDRAGH
jgi:hypothetical protein